jgi:uncharacterized delta-60 repeat protein
MKRNSFFLFILISILGLSINAQNTPQKDKTYGYSPTGLSSLNLNFPNVAIKALEDTSGKCVIGGYTYGCSPVFGLFTFQQASPAISKVQINTFRDVGRDLAKQGLKFIQVGTTETFNNTDIAIVRYGSNYQLDNTFALDGKRVIDMNSYEEASKVIVNKDLKITVGGHTVKDGKKDLFFIRLTENGSLDASFGNKGFIVISSPSNVTLASMHFLADNKILYTANVSEGNKTSIQMGRITENGTLDTSFNHSGFVDFDWKQKYQVLDAQIDLQGKVVITGTVSEDLFVARLHPSGILDTTFSQKGFFRKDIDQTSDQGTSIYIKPNGKLFIACNYQRTSLKGSAIIQLLPNGQLDTKFKLQGVSYILRENETGPTPYLSSLAKTKSGLIYCAGYGTVNDGMSYIISGSLDTSGSYYKMGYNNYFDNFYTCNFTSVASKIKNGMSYILGNGTESYISRNYIVLQKRTINGKPDSSFNKSGHFSFFLPNSVVAASNLCVDAQGKILIVGYTYPTLNSTNKDLLILRLNPDGSFDKSFGKDGVLTYDWGENKDEEAKSVVVIKGSIFVGCNVRTSEITPQRMGILCLKNDGRLDMTFNNTGKKIFFHDYLSYSSEYLNQVDSTFNSELMVASTLYTKSQGITCVNINIIDQYGNDTPFRSGYLDYLGSNSLVNNQFYEFWAQRDNKIILGVLRGGLVNVVRFNTEGRVDTEFGVSGFINATTARPENLFADCDEMERIYLYANDQLYRYSKDGMKDASMEFGYSLLSGYNVSISGSYVRSFQYENKSLYVGETPFKVTKYNLIETPSGLASEYQFSNEELMKFYPNPITSNTKLYISQISSPILSVSLFDIAGAKIGEMKRETRFEAGDVYTFSVSIETLPKSSLYILRCVTTEGTKNLKFLIP